MKEHTVLDLDVRKLIDGLGQGFAIVDLDEKFLFVNQDFSDFLGYDAKELIGASLYTIFASQDHPYVKKAFRSNRVPQVSTLNANLQARNGIRSAAIRLQPNRTDEDNVLGMVWILPGESLPFSAITSSAEEEKFRSLVESSLDGIFIHDGGKFIFVNEQMTKISGFSREELAQIKVLDLVYAEDRDYVKEIIEEREQGKNAPGRYRTRIVRKDGTMRHCEVVASGLKQGGKHVIQGSIRDITEQMLVEQAYKESELRFRMLSQSASDAIITFNQERQIVFFNEAAEKNFGYSGLEAIGLLFDELVPDNFVAELVEQMEEYLETERGNVFDKSLELEGTRKDGSNFPLELSLSTWESSDGHYFTAIIRDITERKEAERKISRMNAILQAQQEATFDGIMVVDREGEILSHNRPFQEIWSLSDDQINSMNLSSLSDYEADHLDNAEEYQTWRKTIESNPEEIRKNDTLRFKDGRIVSRHSLPVKGNEDTIYGRASYYEDITQKVKNHEERNRMYEETLEWKNSLETINKLSEQLNQMLSVEQITSALTEKAQDLIDFEECWIWLWNDADNQLFPAVGGAESNSKKNTQYGSDLCIKPGEGVVGWVLENGEGLLLNDVSSDSRSSEDPVTLGEPASMIAVPMSFESRKIGVLSVIQKGIGHFEQKHLQFLNILARQAAVTIQNARLLEAEKSKADHFFLINQVTKSIADTLDFETLSRKVTLALRKNFNFTDVVLLTYEEDADKFIVAQRAGRHSRAISVGKSQPMDVKLFAKGGHGSELIVIWDVD